MTKPFKEEEFQAFLKVVRKDVFQSWAILAEALHIDKDTVTAWKRTEEGRQAIADGIAHALSEMEKAGKKDWRMWEAKLKMLGVNPPQKVEGKHEVNAVDEILKRFGLLGDNAGEDKETSQDTPKDNT